jgi:hypothetical protein
MLLEIPDYDFIRGIGYLGKDVIHIENGLERRIVLTAGIVIYDAPNDFLENAKSVSMWFMGAQVSEPLQRYADILEYCNEDIIQYIAGGRFDSEIRKKYEYILSDEVILPGKTYLELSSMRVPNVSKDEIRSLIKEGAVDEKLEIRILARDGKFPVVSKLEERFIDGHVLSETLAVSPNSYSKKKAIDLTRLFLAQLADNESESIETYSEKRRLVLFEKIINEIEIDFYRGRDEEEPVVSSAIKEPRKENEVDEKIEKRPTHEGDPKILH